VNRRLVVVPLVAGALFGLAACSGTTTGSGSPATTTDTTSGGATSSSGGTGGGVSTASLQPCDLLSSSDATQLQLTSGGPVNEGGARACTWQKAVDTNGQNGFGIEIGIRDSQGLSGLTTAGYTITPDNVGNHQGKQAALTVGGGCVIAIGVGSSARVDVVVNGGTDTTQACQFGNQVAKAIEPRLPGGGS
jgi:hypothetical protein